MWSNLYRNNVVLFPLVLGIAVLLWSWTFFLPELQNFPDVRFGLLAWLQPNKFWGACWSWLAFLGILWWIKIYSDATQQVPQRSFLTMFAAALLMAPMAHWMQFNEMLIALMLVFVAVSQLKELYNVQDGRKPAFNAGLLIGIAGMLYVYAYYYFVVLIAGLLLFRPMIWREWLLALAGALLPLLYLWAYTYVFEESAYIRSIGIESPVFLNLWHQYFLIGLGALVSILALKEATGLQTAKKITSNSFLILITLALVSLAISIAKPSGGILLLGTIPAAAVSVGKLYFNMGPGRKSAMLNLVFLLLIIALQWLTIQTYDL